LITDNLLIDALIVSLGVSRYDEFVYSHPGFAWIPFVLLGASPQLLLYQSISKHHKEKTMFPIGDDDSTRRTVPWVTFGLIALNILFFFVEMSGGDPFIMRWSFIPRRFLANPTTDFITIFTSMFMHAGWLHLGGNMLYLWIFGDNVEDRFGHLKFLIFYLLCGIAATFAQLMFSMNSNVPNLGASGAIAGVLGSYILLFPQGRVMVLQGRGVFPVPALIVIGLWFVIQLFSGIGSISNTADTGGVAFMAHIGGFIAGFLLTFVFRGASRPRLTV
jgi:membrane associated rhomboid family serine protease